MKLTLKLLFMSVLGLFILTGCRTASIYNVSDSTIEARKGISQEQVYRAIKTAGTQLGWQISKEREGLAKGQIMLRDHSAVVEIPYSTKSYSINYKNSNNLKYDASKQTIHKNYNGWVQNLDNAIRLQLGNLE